MQKSFMIYRKKSDVLLCVVIFLWAGGPHHAASRLGNKQAILPTLSILSKAEFLYDLSQNLEAHEITNLPKKMLKSLNKDKNSHRYLQNHK